MRFSAVLVLSLVLTACRTAPPKKAETTFMPKPSPEATTGKPKKPTQAQPIEKRWTNSFTFKTHSISETHEGFCPYEISAECPEALSKRPAVRRFNRWIRKKILADVARFRWLELRAEPRAKKAGKKLLTEGLELTFEIYFSNQRLISLRLTHRVMAAGQMHPINYYETINYDLKKGKPLTAADVFRRGYLKIFSVHSREYLKTTYEMFDDQWLNEGTAARRVNFENWNLVPDGVLISFEDYQVSAHNFGQPELIVPYSRLLKAVRRPVYQYLLWSEGRRTAIRKIDFANFSYPAKPIYTERGFRVTGGKYKGRPGIPGAESPFGDPYPVSLVALAYGDVTADDNEEAFVVLTESHPGTAITYYIYVYTMSEKNPKLLWAVETGDRGQGGLRKAYAENGELVIELYGNNSRVNGNVFGDDISACCPSSFTRTRYRLVRSQFAQHGESEIVRFERQDASLEMEYRKPD